MKKIIYQFQLWILLLIIPVAGQEKSEQQLATKRVHDFQLKEGLGLKVVNCVVMIAKIDAFVASMKTDTEKEEVMALFGGRYVEITTVKHAERVIKNFLSDRESLSVREAAVNIAAWRRLKNLEPEVLNVFKEVGHTKAAREDLISNLSLFGVDSLIEVRPYLDSEDKLLRTAALEAFARMAPKMTLDKNLALLTHVDAGEREAAVKRLAENGKSVAPAIYKLLDDPADGVRDAAVRVLGELSYEEYFMEALFKKLEKMSNDNSNSVRSQVHSVIVHRFKTKSNPFILEALKDENKYIIEEALIHLRASTIPDEKQIELITPFLKHSKKSIREFAKQSVELLQKK